MSTTCNEYWQCCCGAFVKWGDYHSCAGYYLPSRQQPTTAPPKPADSRQSVTPPATKIDPFFVYERIATALERIAAALEEKKTPDFIAKTQGTPGWK